MQRRKETNDDQKDSDTNTSETNSIPIKFAIVAMKEGHEQEK